MVQTEIYLHIPLHPRVEYPHRLDLPVLGDPKGDREILHGNGLRGFLPFAPGDLQGDIVVDGVKHQALLRPRLLDVGIESNARRLRSRCQQQMQARDLAQMSRQRASSLGDLPRGMRMVSRSTFC